MNIEIRKAAISDIDRIVNLINLTSENLITKGINQWKYPCDRKEVTEEIEEGRVFLLKNDGEIIGSYSIKGLSTFDVICLNQPAKYLYRIIIAPKYQGKKFGDQIIQHLREENLEGKDIYLDCWAGNDKLKKFYTGNGCRYLGDFPEEDYWISVYCI